MADGDGRVTLALVVQKLDTISDQLQALDACVRTDHDKLLLVTRDSEAAMDRIEALEKDNKARTWEARLESLAVAMLAGAGWLKQ